MSYFVTLKIGASNDPVIAGLEINALTAAEPVLLLQSTDDDTTNPFLEMQEADNTVLHSIGLSAIQFQPAVDSLTFFQILDADGGTPILNIDSTNERVGIGTAAPKTTLHVSSDGTTSFRVTAGNNSSALFSFGDPLNQDAGRILYYNPENRMGFFTLDVERIRISSAGNVLISGFTSPTVGLIVKGAAAQTANLFELQESDGSIMLASGDGLGGSVFSGNVQLEDIDFVWAGDTEANLFRIDAGADDVRIGDWDTNYLVTDLNGDTWWVGGGGLPFGSCYGNEIAWTQAAAVQNTWYDISDADMTDGKLHNVTHDGSGQLTVTIAGMYAADWAGSFEADVANLHIEITFSINGTEVNEGTNDFETVAINRESAPSGNAILDLAANDTVNVSIRTTDAGTPDLIVDHLMIRLVQIGGT